MVKVGITGQSGFIGTHLFNYLGLQRETIQLVPFSDTYFNDREVLVKWCSECDVIVHLAAVNRHTDQSVLYSTNMKIIEDLLEAIDCSHSKPHLIFSSSTQEQRDNPYGKSKREGRNLMVKWAEKCSAKFTGLVIPNVFGPFGNPFYNSVIATFSYQLTHGMQPVIENDSELRLIYVGELVKNIHDVILSGISENEKLVPCTKVITVSDLLKLLSTYKESYFDSGTIPELRDQFEVNLFNTFRSYIDLKAHFPFSLRKHSDERGMFVETIKAGVGGQISFSTTKPDVTRGNHFHIRKIERFAVIRGKARIELRRIDTDEVLIFNLSGECPSFVDMPVWYTHNITNTGSDELYTVFWINEFFNSSDPDTYPEQV